MAGVFAGFNRRKVKRGKRTRKCGQSVCQGVTLKHAGPHAQRGALHFLGFGLFRDRAQRLFQWEAGAEQGG